MRELNSKEEDLLYRIETTSELQPFFFRKVKGLHWFTPLYERGLFSPDKNPKPIPAKEKGYFSIPNWPATEYLVATSEDLSSSENEYYAEKFIEIIREITSYARAEECSNYRTWWQLSKVIENIPSYLITLDDIELIDYWLDDPYERGLVAQQLGAKWLPALIDVSDEHCNQIALRLLDSLYKITFVNKKYTSYEKTVASLRYDPSYAKKITKIIAKLSGRKLGLPAVSLFQSRLVAILDELGNDNWSSIWRKAIEEHKQNYRLDDAENLLLLAYRDCLLGFVDSNAEAATVYLQSLFDCPYQTLKRLAIYTIDKRFDIFKDLVDSVLLSEFFEVNFRHELWHLIHNHYMEFSDAQKNKLIKIVEGLIILDDDGIIEEMSTAYKRSIWLSATNNYDEQTTKLYKKYITTTGVEPEHPDFASYSTSGWVEHKSPIPLEQLLSLNIDILVETLNTYQDPGRFGEPGLEGLVKCVKELVKTKANDFYRDLKKFINVDLAFNYSLVEAYLELWTAKSDLPWGDVWPCLFDFCDELIKKDDFWSEENSNERNQFVANRHWLVSEIGRLIEEGTKSDDHAFDESLLPKAKDILLLLIERQEGEEFKLDTDAVSLAINSPRGRCLEALINLTLRACRLEDKELGEHSKVWSQYEKIYYSELQRNDQDEYEFVTLVSNFLPNFIYMSREWVISNLANIFNQSNYLKWLCAMQGYAYTGTVYQDVYKHFKLNGDFLKALDDKNIDDRVQEKVIQNIVVSYIHDYEDISNPESLISILISRKKYKELHQLIWFIWTLRKDDDEKLKEKVFELWPKILEIVDVESRDGRKLASNLCQWAAFIDKIDETTQNWLMKIAPFAEENYNSHDLLESLARISENQALEAQKIWLKILDSYSYDYPEDAIRQILRNLIALGPKGERKAKEIIDAYLGHEIERPSMWLAEEKQLLDVRRLT